jgi:FHS family L-fucose permease-like MFS transporter
MNSNHSTETQHDQQNTSILIPMLIICALFFIFGFVTWLNGSLIPFLKIICELNNFQALLVTFAFYIAYTVMALPSAMVLKHSGYKLGIVLGLICMVIGALIFIPAAQIQHYFLFLTALFILGTGLTLLQTAVNPYIVCCGPRESAAMRISIMGLFNKGAGIVVPIVFTTLILTGMDKFEPQALETLNEQERSARLTELSSRLIGPYLIMAAVLIVFAFFIKFSPLPELQFSEDENKAEIRTLDIFKFSHTVLGAVALFFYVGVEVIAGDTIGLYGQNLGLKNFGALTSYTMSFMVLGYIVGVICIPRFLSQGKALIGSALFGLMFTLGILFSSTENYSLANILYAWSGIPALPNTVLFLAFLGFANALVWPTVWPLALEGLGKYTAAGSALLIMGIAGGAILPLVYGYFAEISHPQSAYWMLLPCYAFILFYAVKGHKMKKLK